MFHQPGNSKGNYNYNSRIYGNECWEPHFHSNYELIYVLSGSIEAEADKERHKLTAGECFLIFPNAVHGFTPISDSRFWVGVFSEDHIAYFSKKYHGKCFSPFRLDGDVEALLISRLFVTRESSVEERIALLNLVCDQCERHANITVHSVDNDLKNRILIYFTRHLSENITLQDMADSMGYEYHYLSRKFNDCFGIPFKKCLNQHRFALACELLTGTDKSLTDIALECGFGSLRTFDRVFAEYGEMTPRQYREYGRGEILTYKVLCE